MGRGPAEAVAQDRLLTCVSINNHFVEQTPKGISWVSTCSFPSAGHFSCQCFCPQWPNPPAKLAPCSTTMDRATCPPGSDPAGLELISLQAHFHASTDTLLPTLFPPRDCQLPLPVVIPSATTTNHRLMAPLTPLGQMVPPESLSIPK